MPRKGKRTELAQWIAAHPAPAIGGREWEELLATLAPVSPSYLRKLLRESGAPLTPLIEGVRQENLQALERSLLALLGEYQAGDALRKHEVRKRVIEGKDHARWASKEQPEKVEMVLWMLTWLENPPLFPDWVTLRKQTALDS